jgi:hypothetical protein
MSSESTLDTNFKSYTEKTVGSCNRKNFIEDYRDFWGN